MKIPAKPVPTPARCRPNPKQGGFVMNDTVHADDELLVAYLDNELDRDTRDAVEDRLVDEQPFRKRLRQLQRGWEMLDALPDDPPHRDVVKSTMEMAVIDATSALPVQGSKRGVPGWLRFLGMALVVGIGGVALDQWNQYRQRRGELAVLPIVQNFDGYLHGRDLELIATLEADESWREMLRTVDIQPDPVATLNLRQVGVFEVDERLDALEPNQKAELASRVQRFDRLDQEQREALIACASQVDRRGDAEALRRAMNQYAQWRETLPRNLLERIEQDVSDDAARADRTRAIAEAIEETIIMGQQASAASLSAETTAVIGDVIDLIFQQRVRDEDPEITRILNRTRPWLRERQRKPGRFLDSVTAEEIAKLQIFGGMQFRRGGPPKTDRQTSQRFDSFEVQQILTALPQADYQILQRLTAGDPTQEELVLQWWVESSLWQAFNRKWRPSYSELSPEEREWMDLLPPDRFFREIVGRDKEFRPPGRPER